MNKKFDLKKTFKDLFTNYLVLVAIVLLVLVTMIAQPKFLSSGNMTNIMRQFGPLSLVALGMTFVIIGGFIDLSVAGIFSLVAVVTLSLIDPIGQVGALIVGLCLGAFCGFFNSILLLTAGALTQAEALFITFGMSLVYGAFALMKTGGSVLNMRDAKSDTSLFKLIGQGTVGIFTVSFLIFLVCLLVLFLFQSKTAMGRAISLTGGNKTAARLAGLPVDVSIMVIYTLSGLMAALGAVNQFARVTTASPVMGKGFETNAILAVVVGGTTLKGGKGSVLRTVLGTLLIILMSNCLNLLGVTPFMQNVTKGAILVLAIWLDNRKPQ
ncbi:MAG: ABC transporter permease [Eubacteriales bacterium]